MSRASRLRLVILKPSKYGIHGDVERFRWEFMPNSTIAHLASMTLDQLGGSHIETAALDEYVQTDLGYLQLLEKGQSPTVLTKNLIYT